MPAISVVIPVYNAAPFLREALDSLLAQTCGDFEAIAVNDGSTDNSLEILQEYAARDSRIRILDGPNGGYGKAMNRGMDAATGKYMAILEPDDYLPREAYAILLEKAEKHQLDVVRGAHCSFFEQEGHREYMYRTPQYELGRVFRPLDDIPGVFQCGPGIWCNIYGLSFLRQYGIRFHESPGASYQDTGFFLLCAVYAERYMLIPDAVYMYRMDNPASSVKSVDGKRDALLKEYEYIKACLKKNPDIWPLSSLPFYWCFMCGQRWVYRQLSEAIRPGFVETLRTYVAGCLNDGAMLPETEWLMQSIAHGNDEVLQEFTSDHGDEKQKNIVKKIMGFSWYSVSMSAERTVRRLFGVPILERRRVAAWQQLAPWLVVANGYKNRYFLFGVPLGERWSVPCGKLVDAELVPAMVNPALM